MADVQADFDGNEPEAVTSTAFLPVLVIKNVTDDDDELLFQPDSPPSERTSSVGTPPTPEPSKFVWPVRKEDQTMQERKAEPTETVRTFDSFTLSKPEETACSADDPPPCSSSEASDLNYSFSTVRTIKKDGENEKRVSMVLTDSKMPTPNEPSHQLNSAMQAVKKKTHTATSHSREAISRFQLKGGLVGWLHGESGGDLVMQADDNSCNVDQATEPPAFVSDSTSSDAATTFTFGAPSRQRASSLFGNLCDKMRQTHEQLEHKLQALEASSVGDHHDDPHSRPPQPRQSLQSASRRSLDLNAKMGVDVGDFVSAMSTNAGPQPADKLYFRSDSRMRSTSLSDAFDKPSMMNASGERSRLRSLSLATRTTKPQLQGTEITSAASSSSTLQRDPFPVEECLADPKLAAEFINTVLPGDEWLLALLYSIEEYETLATTTTTSAGDSTPFLAVQMTLATSIIDRFLSSPTCAKYSELEAMGKEVRSVMSQYQLPSETGTAVPPARIAALIAAQGATMPRNLFDSVYTSVLDTIREAYDTQFRLSREYTHLLAQRKQQQERHGGEKTMQHLVHMFDQVMESEWCCTVFWVYLFRTSHHYRLSFIMDVQFKLRQLHLAAQQWAVSSPEAVQANRLVQHEILRICRRSLFDSKLAPLAVPMTSPMLVQLKEDLEADATELEASVEPEYDHVERMIQKLDAMCAQTRVDFKYVSCERFASFLSSALYRDCIVDRGSVQSTQRTRASELTQLLRSNRIPFHQTAVSPPKVRDLMELRTGEDGRGVFDRAVATVFAFRENTEGESDAVGQHFAYRSLYVSAREEDATGQSLQKKVECFLVPEGFTTSDAAKRSPVCFNFLAGTGDDTLYGALWRFEVSASHVVDGESREASSTKNEGQGVCILSRYPLVDALREYLRSFALTCASDASGASTVLDILNEDSLTSAIHATARDAFEAHCSLLFKASLSPLANEIMDTTFQDLFECLSMTNAMRLVSLTLQEKKIVLVSSSYSVLLSVGETLRAIMSPLTWSHIYVPVLPMGMKDYLHCPTPFIFGLHVSYVRQCELPKPSDDLAVVNLDRDSVTGGGDVYMPPLRANTLREKLTALCKPRLRSRDTIQFSQLAERPVPFPSTSLRHVFQQELRDILRHLETFAFRFECADRVVSVVDTSNKLRQWPVDAARFYSAILQSQAFSTFLGCQSI